MTKQISFKKVDGWGGKRRGAGRPNRTNTVSHGKRERVDFKKPLHITLRLKKGVQTLRTRATLHSFRAAAKKAGRFDMHVIHYALESNHLHMIVEAKNNGSLARGMKSLNGRLGKLLQRGGSAWAGRFHMRVLKSPTEMKNALRYVLLNHSKHTDLLEHLDEFSSGTAFPHWKELLGRKLNDLVRGQIGEIVEGLSPPQSWLCKTGWMRAPVLN